SPERQRADNILNEIITPAAPGYRVVRADKIGEPGHIAMQIIQHILDAELVVADLSSHNPNGFYELAVRHATRKPVLHLIGTGERIPFDVAQQRTIVFDVTDLRSARQAREALAQQIAAVEANPENFDNPLSMALGVLDLRRSTLTADQVLAHLL